MINKEQKEKYYRCRECESLTTNSEILDECGSGGAGMCYCKFDQGRILIPWTQISKETYINLKENKNKYLLKFKKDNPQLSIVLRKMHEVADVDFSKFNNKDGWFNKHSWLPTMESKFKRWLSNKLYSNKDMRRELMSNIFNNTKKNCKAGANTFIFNYGWKLEYDPISYYGKVTKQKLKRQR